MSSHIGVIGLPAGITLPVGAYAHTETKANKRKTVKTPNNLGVTTYFDQMPYNEGAVDVKGTGAADLTLVVAGRKTAGTLQVLKAKTTHDLGKRPEFDYSARVLTNDA